MGLRGVVKFFTIRAVEGMVAILLITFMPNLPPDAKYSQTYSLTPVMPFEGSLTLNDKLQTAEKWHKGDLNGPEAFAMYNGELYTSVHGGNVVKLIGDNIVPVVKFGKECKGFYQEHICGRPLGMQFDKHGGLYVADAYYGIFKVDVKTGKQLQLISMDQEVNGKKPKLPNSVSVASNGDIYWTDSSTEFYLYDGVFDMLADGSGRLIHYDAKTKKNTVLIDKIHFANGVRLAADESFVIVTETARCRIYRYHLKGPKKGTYDTFLDGLPGLPDNVQTDGKDGFLITLVVGRDDDYPPPLNIMGPFPLLRKFLSRVLGLTELGFKVLDQIYPSEWAEKAIHYVGHFESLPHSFDSPRQTILHISKDGTIIDSVHSLNGSVIGICEAFILKDMLYMGSPFNNYIGRIPLKQIGWEHLTRKETDYPSSTAAENDVPTLKPKVAQPTPKAAPTRPITTTTTQTTTPSHSTSPPPTKQTPSPSSVKEAPSSTVKETPPPSIKDTSTHSSTKESPPPSIKEAAASKSSIKESSPASTTSTATPPSPTKQTTSPPSPTKQTESPVKPVSQHPTKQTTEVPSPTKEYSTPPSTKTPITTPPTPSAQQTTPSPHPVKDTPPTKQTTTQPPTSTKQATQSLPPAKQTTIPPPPPTKQTTPPSPPTKQTTPPSPPTKQPSPPSPPTQQTTLPSPPTKQTAPPAPPTKQTAPPAPPTKQTVPPPPPTKQTAPPPPPTKQTAPPPPPTKQTTPPPPPTKQTTPPSPPAKQTAPPSPSAKQTAPPSPSAKQTAPPPPAKQATQPPAPVKKTIPPPSPTKQTAPPSKPPSVTTQKQAPTPTPRQAPPTKQEMKNEL